MACNDLSGVVNAKDVTSPNIQLNKILKCIDTYNRAANRYKNSYDENGMELGYDASRQRRKLFRYGKFVAKMVEEFVDSGQLEEAQKDWLNSTFKAIRIFSKIEGMGPIRAAELVEQGMRTIEDLFCNTDKLTRQQIIGLEHYHDLNQKIPLDEVQEIISIISNLLETSPEKYKLIMTGEGRRCRPRCSQIDCLLVSEKSNALDEAVTILKNLIIDVICMGPTKFKGICRLNDNSPARRLIIRFASPMQFPFLLLYHTGSPHFVKSLMKAGLKRGLLLFEHTMRTKDTHQFVTVSSEEDLFGYLGMEFVSPECR